MMATADLHWLKLARFRTHGEIRRRNGRARQYKSVTMRLFLLPGLRPRQWECASTRFLRETMRSCLRYSIFDSTLRIQFLAVLAGPLLSQFFTFKYAVKECVNCRSVTGGYSSPQFTAEKRNIDSCLVPTNKPSGTANPNSFDSLPPDGTL